MEDDYIYLKFTLSIIDNVRTTYLRTFSLMINI